MPAFSNRHFSLSKVLRGFPFVLAFITLDLRFFLADFVADRLFLCLCFFLLNGCRESFHFTSYSEQKPFKVLPKNRE